VVSRHILYRKSGSFCGIGSDRSHGSGVRQLPSADRTTLEFVSAPLHRLNRIYTREENPIKRLYSGQCLVQRIATLRRRKCN
jgi:hypothetical protein